MTGTKWPTTETEERLACVRCTKEVTYRVANDIPGDRLLVMLPCGAVYVCAACIAEHGGSRGACRRNAEDWHRERRGCPGCKA
jgi:hypothetical protein